MRDALPLLSVLAALVSLVQADTLYVGAVDTVGGTTRDWQYCFPIRRRLVNSPGVGLHVNWSYGREARDIAAYYNFYDYARRGWVFR